MVQRIVRLLGVFAPILSVIIAYQIWFGFKYTISGSDFTTRTITALQFAVEGGSTAILFWPIFLFLLSMVGALGAWKKVEQLVWVVAITFIIISVLGAWSIGLLVVPLALLFIAISILLHFSDKGG